MFPISAVESRGRSGFRYLGRLVGRKGRGVGERKAKFSGT